MNPMDERTDARNATIAASTDAVYAALTDPTRVPRWWGPDGFHSTIHQFELHPGGTWRMTLHGPDGADYPNEYRVLRVEPGRLLELEHPQEGHHFTLTLELSADGEGTRVAWRQAFLTSEQYRPLASFLAQANAQVLARLAAEALGGGPPPRVG